MKVLLVLWGESFRSGSQMSRTRGTNDYYIRQKLASLSHIKLIEHIKHKFNLDIDLFINTYKLNDKDDNNLINFYKGCNIKVIKFYDNIFSSEACFLNNMYDIINPILDNYEYTLFVRIDLYLKQYFFEILRFDINKIFFAHIDSNINIYNNPYFGVAHLIMLYPKKFYNVIKDKIIYNETHGIKDNIINYISNDIIDYFIYTLHVCSTDVGWNPIYLQVGRHDLNQYNTTLRHGSNTVYYYDIITKQFIYDINKTIIYYEKKILEDTLEQNITRII